MKIEEQLEVALAEFKASYLEKITQWSKEQVERNVERRNSYKRMVLTPENRNQYYAEQRWVHSSPLIDFDIDPAIPVYNVYLDLATKYHMPIDNLPEPSSDIAACFYLQSIITLLQSETSQA